MPNLRKSLFASLLSTLMLSAYAIEGQSKIIENKFFDGSGQITLTAADSGTVIRNCTFKNLPSTAITIDGATDITIENCRFENIRREAETGMHGIACQRRCSNVTINNNEFVDMAGDGIQMGNRCVDIRHINITNNKFWSTGLPGENGVDLKTLQGPTLISRNTFHGFRPCNSPQPCTGSGGQALVLHMGTNDVVIERNVFYDNTIAIKIHAGNKPGDAPPNRIIVKNNLIYDNVTYGIQLGRSTAVSTYNNTLLNNGTHFVAKDVDTCRSANNLFTGTGGSNSDNCRGTSNLQFSEAAIKFVDSAKRNLRLAASSPAINRGTAIAEVKDDIDGQPRSHGSGYDIGADEYAHRPRTQHRRSQRKPSSTPSKR